MGPVKCEILLDKPSKIYYTGETVEGKVAINLRSATRISVINLHLIGQATFGLFGQDNFEFFHETKSVEVNKILPSGSHKFPIVWTLPDDLISTFIWKSGCASYSFVMEMKNCQSASSSFTKFLIESVKASTTLEIRNDLDLNGLSTELQRSRGYNASFFHASGSEDNVAATIAFDFVVDRQCYVPGEFMKFTCSITYENQDRPRKFPGVRVTLDQEDTYVYNGSVTTSVTKVWLKTGPKIRPNDITIWEDQIKIPNYCQSTPTDPYGIISIQYFLNVTAGLWNTTEKPQFRIPIVIGIIPLQQLHQNNLPMIQNPQRPSVTILNGNSEHSLEDFEVEEEDLPVILRSESPPPSYEEAVLQTIAGNCLPELEMSPPPYTVSMNLNLKTMQPFL